MIAGLVIFLMAVWGIQGTLRGFVNRGTTAHSIRGQSIQEPELQDARGALSMLQALRLNNPVTPYAMGSRGAPMRATIKMQALADDFSQFVFAGQKTGADLGDAAWRYLVLAHEADSSGVQVTDGEVAELLHYLPQFTDKNGDFSADVYTSTISHYGVSDADMARWLPELARVAKLIIMQRQAVLVSNAELWMAYVYSNETVSIRYVEIDGALFRPLVQPTDEELTKFYDEHCDLLTGEGPDGIGYKAPERIRAEYALIPVELTAKQVQVSDDEVAAYYKDHKEDYRIAPEAKPQPAGAAAPQKPEEPRYKPLDQVRDEIRKKLTGDKAKEKADHDADAIITDLDAIKANYENTPQPLEQMARRHGAVFQTVKTAEGRPLVTREELAKLVPGGTELAGSVFDDRTDLYSPVKVAADQGAVVFQVLEYREPERQPYQDVQAQVRNDCTQRMAVASAQTFADKLKARADDAGLEVAAAEMTPRLANLVKAPQGKEAPVLKVQESAFFRRGAQSVPGIEGNTQDKLIDAAFALSGKQTAVAITGTPPTTVCVIQASQRKPASPEGFATLDPGSCAGYLAQKQERIVQAWAQGLLDKSPLAPATKG
jgi:hypothetical protein